MRETRGGAGTIQPGRTATACRERLAARASRGSSNAWRALDPTHNRPADETHGKLAVGRDDAEVPPVTGNYKGTTNRTMNVAVNIREPT